LLKREIDCETEAREFDNVRNELHRQLEEKDAHIHEMVQDLTRSRDEIEAIRGEVEAATDMKLEKANSQIAYL
jgi:peptidoglycan hydrolase CwlO-like protein